MKHKKASTIFAITILMAGCGGSASNSDLSSLETQAEQQTTKTNKPPTVSEVLVDIDAGSNTTIELIGTDIDNEPLTYSLTQKFDHIDASINANLLTLNVPYGVYGEQLASYVANDGKDDSNNALIKVNVSTSQTQPFSVIREHSDISAVKALSNDKIMAVGTTNTHSQFIAIYNGNGELEKAQDAQQYLFDKRSTIHVIEQGNGYALLAYDRFETDVAIFVLLDEQLNEIKRETLSLPFGLNRLNRHYSVTSFDNLGFYMLGGDQQLLFISSEGELTTGNSPLTPMENYLGKFTIQDAKIVDDKVHLVGATLRCGNDLAICSSLHKRNAFTATANLDGSELKLSMLAPDTPIDSALLPNGDIALLSEINLQYFDSDKTPLWQRRIDIDMLPYIGQLSIAGNADIMLWVYSSHTNQHGYFRVSNTNELLWELIESADVKEGFITEQNMLVDQYGNMFISYVDLYQGNINWQDGDMHNIYVDYSGKKQWQHQVSGLTVHSANVAETNTALTSSQHFVTLGSPRDIGLNDFISIVKPIQAK
ncbi:MULTISPECIES: hypothetical protein [Pseudoalteromonas]|nr:MULTISPECIES: hypothetical protein [Pseudoalteromonas]